MYSKLVVHVSLSSSDTVIVIVWVFLLSVEIENSTSPVELGVVPAPLNERAREDYERAHRELQKWKSAPNVRQIKAREREQAMQRQADAEKVAAAEPPADAGVYCRGDDGME